MISIRSAPDLVQALHIQFRELPSNARHDHVHDLIDSARRSRIELSCFAAVCIEHGAKGRPDNTVCIEHGARGRPDKTVGIEHGARGRPDKTVCEQERIVAVQSFVLQRDGTSHVYPVVFTDGESEGTATADGVNRDEVVEGLFNAIDKRFVDSNAWIAQSLLRSVQTNSGQELSQHGYPHLTDLLFMELTLDEDSEWSGGVAVDQESFETLQLETVEYSSSRNDRFAKLLDQTYIGSADCPELNGRRSGQHALESHKLSGEFSEDMWQVIVHDQQDVGVILLSEHGAGVCEIVYLALIPSARRKGWGRAMLNWGLERAHQNGNESVMLGVDVRNRPAIQMYEQAGFREFDHRIVHARFREQLVSRDA
jgi:ribosomal protein S18 acetylase RimI-like enzyme